MAESLLLKWNNHKETFLWLLSTLHKKNIYSDVTLACAGQLYNVHKMVLSSCSDYFSTIFDSITCPNPVIILKDISASKLEAMLDYMYLGEVSVRQADLSSLIQAAECLQLRGLAIPDNTDFKSDSRKRLPELSSPQARKKNRKSQDDEIPNQQKTTLDEAAMEESSFQIQPCIKNVVSLKADVVTIEDEEPKDDDYVDAWDFNAHPEDSHNIDQNHHKVEDATGSDPLSPSIPKSVQDGPDQHCCNYCSRTFRKSRDLKRHVMIHTGEKPFVCPHCPYRANRKSSLASHVLNIHMK